MRHESPIMPEEILIRPAAAADAPGLLAIYAPYVRKTAITFEYDVPSEEEFRGRIERTLERFPYLAAYRYSVPADSGDPHAAAAEDPHAAGEEELLGYAYAGHFKSRAAYDWACEVSIYVREDMKRRGIGRRLYEALELCLEAMGMRNLYACIGVPEEDDEYLNHDSVRFHERLGYRVCGTFRRCGYKFNRWYDMCWMEKFLVPPEEGLQDEQEIPPVIPFPEMVRRTAVCRPEDESCGLLRILRDAGEK